MPTYRYTATNAEGERVKIDAAADSARALRDGLRQKGWLPIRVRELSPRGDGEHNRFSAARDRWLRSRRRPALASFFEGTGTLLAIGMPLVAAIDSIGESAANRSLRRLCLRLGERVREGETLSAVCGDHPDWFDRIDESVLRAAEQAGGLDDACAELAMRHAERDELGAKLVAALTYPLVLVMMGVGVAVFLSSYTLPKIVGVLQDNQAPIPPSTRALMTASGIITERPLLAVLALLAATALCAAFAFSGRFEAARWRIPLIGTTLRESALSRASTQIAWLVDAGVSLHEALRLTSESCSSTIVAGALAKTRSNLSDGVSMTDAVKNAGVFGTVFVRAVALGDESGEVSTILRRLGVRYKASTVRSLARVTSIIEPAAIIAIAAIIGFVAYASILPMLRVSESLY